MRKVTAKQFFNLDFLLAFFCLLAIGLILLIVLQNIIAFVLIVFLMAVIGALNYLMCENHNITLDYIDSLNEQYEAYAKIRVYLEENKEYLKQIKELTK